MTKPIVVLDTSVIITAVASGGWNYTHDLIELLPNFRVLTCQEILDEVKAALEYKHIIDRLNQRHLAGFLETYYKFVELVEIEKKYLQIAKKGTTDPGDEIFLALSHQVKANFLVSLDAKHLLILKNWKGTKIVRPKEVFLVMQSQLS